MNIRDGRCVVRRCALLLAVLVAAAAPVSGQGAARATPETTPAAPPPPVSLPMTPRDAVEDIVARYRLAFSALDAAAAKAVWPTVDERSLARAFRQLESQELTFAECQTEMASTGTQGKVTCRGSVRFVPRIGGRAERVELRRWEFVVSRFASEWRLIAVNSTATPQPR